MALRQSLLQRQECSSRAGRSCWGPRPTLKPSRSAAGFVHDMHDMDACMSACSLCLLIRPARPACLQLHWARATLPGFMMQPYHVGIYVMVQLLEEHAQQRDCQVVTPELDIEAGEIVMAPGQGICQHARLHHHAGQRRAIAVAGAMQTDRSCTSAELGANSSQDKCIWCSVWRLHSQAAARCIPMHGSMASSGSGCWTPPLSCHR